MSPQGLQAYAKGSAARPKVAVEAYIPLVKRIALHMHGRLPRSVPLDDIMQAGLEGLLQAAGKYDPNGDASFETFAGIRIRGAIIDEVRRNQWGTRSMYRAARQISEAIEQVEGREGREAQDADVAAELGVDLEQYHRMLGDVASGQVVSFEDLSDDGDIESRLESDEEPPHARMERASLRRALAEAIKTLPEREQQVLSLYYVEELNLKEIGQVLGVTESRVSQIRTKAACRLRARLTGWLPD